MSVFLERLEAEAVDIFDVQEKPKDSVVVDLGAHARAALANLSLNTSDGRKKNVVPTGLTQPLTDTGLTQQQIYGGESTMEPSLVEGEGAFSTDEGGESIVTAPSTVLPSTVIPSSSPLSQFPSISMPTNRTVPGSEARTIPGFEARTLPGSESREPKHSIAYQKNLLKQVQSERQQHNKELLRQKKADSIRDTVKRDLRHEINQVPSAGSNEPPRHQRPASFMEQMESQEVPQMQSVPVPQMQIQQPPAPQYVAPLRDFTPSYQSQLRDSQQSHALQASSLRDSQQSIGELSHQVVSRDNRDDQIRLAQAVENQNLKKVLTTPRMQQACKELGILPAELQIKQPSEFQFCASDPPARIQMRFSHYENKRQEKLKLVLEARSRLMASQFERLGHGGKSGETVYSLQLMEDLLDQEAKKLEKKLRQEVRLHAAIEKENEEQLAKEKQVKEKMVARDQKKILAEERRRQEAALKTQHVEAKLRNSKQNRHHLDEYEQARQAQILAVQFEDEVRVREFQSQKQIEQSVKSDAWERKTELIKQRNQELELEKEIRAEQQALKFDEKLEALEKRKAEEAHKEQIRYEEANLKVIDAQERKNRLERQDQHRREKVSEQIVESQSRINSLLNLKSQLLEQRKKRAKETRAGVTKSLNIKALDPGPGAYNIPSTLDINNAPKITEPKNLAPVEGSFDHAVAKTRDNPPPGSYDPQLLPTGEKTLTDKGGKMHGRANSNFADVEARIHKDKPGPGSYNTIGDMTKLKHGAKIGSKINFVPPGNEAELAKRPPKFMGRIDKDLPGPGAYAVDPFTRQERLQKASRNLAGLFGKRK